MARPVPTPMSSRVTPSSLRSSFWPSLQSCLRSSRVSSPALTSVRRKPLPIRPPLLPLPWQFRSMSRPPLLLRTTRPLSKAQHQQKISGVQLRRFFSVLSGPVFPVRTFCFSEKQVHCQSSAVTNCRPLRDMPPTSVTLPLPAPRSDSTSPGTTGASGRRHSA